MGAWGSGLYQNDTALDVKDEFEKLFNDGKSVQEITDGLTAEFESIMDCADEAPLFWLALADTQWKFGVLLPDVKENALRWIDELKSQAADTPDEAKQRKALENLQAKLLSPLPPVKKPKKKRIYKCEWKIGDVFAYQLESELAKERGLYGRYFLIQKVDEGTWYPGHIVPIIYVKLTKDANIPSTVEEYDEAEYVQTFFQKYERRFWPIDMSRPQEYIEEKSKLNYEVDEYGFLPAYRAILLNTSKRVIPKKLIYVGNFPNAIRPQKEFIPHSKDSLITVFWKRFDETFESKMIKMYCGHNLRELSIYADKKHD